MEQASLDALPPELQYLVQRQAPWSARATSTAFRRHIEAARTSLRLRLPPPLHPTWSPAQLHAMLARLPRLTALSGRVHAPTDLPTLALPTLTDLHVSYSPMVVDARALTACTSLTSLAFTMLSYLADLPALAALPGIATLRLTQCSTLSNLWPLASAGPALTELDLSGCHSVADLSPLASCAGLTSVNLSTCCGVADVTPLSSCTAITCLDLESCTLLQDVAPLGACPALARLCLRHCCWVQDVGPLASCALRSLDVRGCRSVTLAGFLTVCDACPGLEFVV